MVKVNILYFVVYSFDSAERVTAGVVCGSSRV